MRRVATSSSARRIASGAPSSVPSSSTYRCFVATLVLAVLCVSFVQQYASLLSGYHYYWALRNDYDYRGLNNYASSPPHQRLRTKAEGNRNSSSLVVFEQKPAKRGNYNEEKNRGRGRAGMRKEERGGPQKTTEERQPDYHVVFSTSCSPLQDWQSFVFFYHAMKVKQQGSVTRIASGCTVFEMRQLQNFHDRFVRPMSDRFFLHLTPDFSRVRLENGQPYKYMNKP